MTRFRLAAVALTAFLLPACGLLASTPTPADEDEFLVNMAVAGVLVGDTEDEMLGLGYAVCEDFRNGNPMSVEISMLVNGGLSNGQAIVLATSAAGFLCPDDAPDLDS